jgi:hypothetical protein
MYSDVVMEKAFGIELKDEESGIRKQLEKIMLQRKQEKGYASDTQLTAADLKELCRLFKAKVKEVLKKDFGLSRCSNYGVVLRLCSDHGILHGQLPIEK